MSLDDFQILDFLGKICILGEGAYSRVYRVLRLKDNKEYALKKVVL